MRALLLYNPNATTTNAAVTDVIAKALSAELKLDVEATKRRNHAGFIAAGAVHEGYEVILALGGDGTLNEVMQGVAGTDVPMAIIPGGSTNVWARTLGLPNDAVEATSVILSKLRTRETRTVNLGLCNGRYFGFAMGFGYDAEVVRMVERRYRMKRTVRQATFLWCGLLAWLAGRSDQAEITVRPADAPDEAVTGLKAMVCCNSNPFTYLGPLPVQMCPDADLLGGLDLTGLTSTDFGALMRLARTALFTANVERLRFVEALRDRPGYHLEASAPLPIHVDGDYIGESDRVELRSAPGALRVVA